MSASRCREESHLHSSNHAFHSLHLLLNTANLSIKPTVYFDNRSAFLSWFADFVVSKWRKENIFKQLNTAKFSYEKGGEKKMAHVMLTGATSLLPTVLESAVMFKFNTSMG